MMRSSRCHRLFSKVICFALLLLSLQNIEAQNVNNQRQLDEKLAREFYYKKDYEKARDIYKSLYDNFGNVGYFNQYADCLILTGDYKAAEKAYKAFLKKNPKNWKSHVDLAYIYQQQGENDKAAKYLNKVLKDVPENKNSIIEVSNLLRTRSFNDFAILLFNKGAKNSNINYNFYLEKAYTYNSMLDFENATECYLLYLKENPDQYENVKSRLRVMMMYDINGNVNDVIRMALLRKTQEEPDNEEYSSLLMWYSLQQQDYEMALTLLKALDKRGKGDFENDIVNIAQIAYDNRQYDISIDAYNYILKKHKEGVYYVDATIGLIEAEYAQTIANGSHDKGFYEKLSGRIDNALAEMGYSKETISLITIQAEIMAFELGQFEEAKALLNNALEVNLSPRDKAVLKMKLADIYLFTDEVWEATLLYSQIEKALKNEPIAHEARFKNAQLRYFIGEFEWANAALKVLTAATSKLVANDAMTLSLTISDNLEYDTIGLQRIAKADYYIYQHRYVLANQMLDSVVAYNPNEVSLPSAFYRKAKIAMHESDYELADSLYKRVYEGYADSYIADEALIEDALLLENQLNRQEEAMERYSKLLDYYTASVYVAQARKNYRRLRDELNK
ncbi:MAG: tetratricopeptide repeat protein [Bacteroidales bacterium]|nr:tetratricopeptide repeat protein [Bacteroidales bacterium]